MRVLDAYGPGRFGLSFELFPPKSEASEEELFRHLDELATFQPSYITCTYGAGGSTQAKTLDIVERVHRRYSVPVASHLTCVGSTQDQLRAYLREADARGVTNIVALRGDPPKGEAEFRPPPGGFQFAAELVAMIHREFPQLGVAVAGYPETHREASSPEADLLHLRDKLNAGGDVVLTQLFYDNADFFRFEERCRAIGITAPIVPGILPVTNHAQIQRIASLCGARLPAEFAEDLAREEGNPDGQFRVGVDFAIRQVRQLLDHGVSGLHFYVLNKSAATAEILRAVQFTSASA